MENELVEKNFLIREKQGTSSSFENSDEEFGQIESDMEDYGRLIQEIIWQFTSDFCIWHFGSIVI